tara:strand:+ start:53 stop:352 length:300 start_codon:yes stop_codon:yes gene_type:complete
MVLKHMAQLLVALVDQVVVVAELQALVLVVPHQLLKAMLVVLDQVQAMLVLVAVVVLVVLVALVELMEVMVVLALEFPLHSTIQYQHQDLEQDHKLVVV